MRNIFGWSLPPGCTNRMIDEAAGVDQPCAVCAMDVADCCCPECPVCGENGNPQCYETSNGDKRHGLKLNKEQAIARQKAVVYVVKQRVQDEEQCLAAIESTDDNMTWHLDDTLDPWG
jgi:hypothetical protein